MVTFLLCQDLQEVLFVESLSENVLINEPLLPLSLDVVVGDEFEAARSVIPLRLLHELRLHERLLRNIVPQGLSDKVPHYSRSCVFLVDYIIN